MPIKLSKRRALKSEELLYSVIMAFSELILITDAILFEGMPQVKGVVRVATWHNTLGTPRQASSPLNRK